MCGELLIPWVLLFQNSDSGREGCMHPFISSVAGWEHCDLQVIFFLNQSWLPFKRVEIVMYMFKEIKSSNLSFLCSSIANICQHVGRICQDSQALPHCPEPPCICLFILQQLKLLQLPPESAKTLIYKQTLYMPRQYPLKSYQRSRRKEYRSSSQSQC
jgi:hypothetical protein